MQRMRKTTASRQRGTRQDAETALALALQAGATSADYARAKRLSLNTVYTHLRRLREKTGSCRLHELIAKFDALRSPLRLELC